MSVETCLQQLQFANYVMKANVGDITHQESLIQPKSGGNCLNWVLGHMVVIRSHFLRGFGGKTLWTDAECERYDRHGQPLTDPANAKPLSEIWAALEETLQSMTEIISKFTPEQMAQKAPFSPNNKPDETIGSLVATFVFHDAYHAGQTGVLRRLIGRSPADL